MIKSIFTFFLLTLFITAKAQEENSYSVVTVPFEVSLSNLARDIDKTIGKVILRDSSLTDNNNDQLQYNLVKNKPLKIISVKDKVIQIKVPIQVWAQKGIGAMGFYSYGSTKFEMELSFKIAYSILPNWSLQTKTYADGYKWIQTPSLSVGGVSVPMTTIFDQVLKYQQPAIAKEIDYQIADNVNLKDNVTSLWNQFAEPILLSDSFNTWMTIVPVEIFATPFVQNSKSIVSVLGFKLINTTYVGRKPTITNYPKNVPNLRYVTSLPKDFNLVTNVYASYDFINNSIEAQYNTMDIDYKEGKKITLSNIRFGQEEGKMKITCDASDAFTGKIELIGTPYFDSTTYSIKVRDLDFGYKTKNLLHKSAAWILNGLIEKKLGKQIDIPMRDEIDDMKAQTEMGLTSYKDGIYTICHINKMLPTHILLTDENLRINILTVGNLSVTY